MKECVECGKKLGIIEGYRHPTLGEKSLVCSVCFDAVSASVDQWGKVVASYSGFFTKELSTREDLQRIGTRVRKDLTQLRGKVLHQSSQKHYSNVHEKISSIV